MEPLLKFTSLSDKLFDSTVPLLFDRADPDAVKAADDCYRALIKEGRVQGWFPYRVAVGAMPELVGRLDKAQAFHERLRHAVDPHNLIAPGRYR
jgi:4-cresol dehydrogenase (hydroxylating)